MVSAICNRRDSVLIQIDSFSVGFISDNYKISLPESIRVNSTIKIFEIGNINNLRKSNAALRCDITQGDDAKMFEVNFVQNSCVVVLKKMLDFETRKKHELTLVLSSSNYYVNSDKNMAKLTVQVQDENDNSPEFIFDTALGANVRNNTYYATVQPSAFIDTSILQVKAIDRDAGDYGRVKYRIYDQDEGAAFKPSTYFSIGEDSGVVKVHRSLKMVTTPPLIFFVDATDNNGNEGDGKTKVNKATARIVVNFLTDANRLALAFSDLPPKSLRAHSESLKNMLAEKLIGHIVMIEGFSNRQFINSNGIAEENPDATDVWFYIIDPQTEKILDRNDALIQSQFIEKAAQSDINYEASNIAKATAQGIYSPIVAAMDDQIRKTKTAVVIRSDVFPYTLIAVALLILIFGAFGIVYICVSWANYKNFKQRMRQYTTATINTTASMKNYDTMNTMVASRPASQHSDSQSQLKEYETQVLAMAVNTDDDLQLDFSAKNHTFNLDNVSYITHKKNG